MAFPPFKKKADDKGKPADKKKGSKTSEVEVKEKFGKGKGMFGFGKKKY